MFIAGEEYEIVTGIGEEEGHSIYTVKEWDRPLLKVVDGVGQEYIFNTSAVSFVSANRRDPDFVRKPSRISSLLAQPKEIGPDGWPVED